MRRSRKRTSRAHVIGWRGVSSENGAEENELDEESLDSALPASRVLGVSLPIAAAASVLPLVSLLLASSTGE